VRSAPTGWSADAISDTMARAAAAGSGAPVIGRPLERRRDLGHDGARGGRGVGCARDRAAHDEQIRTRADRVARRRHAFLIAFGRARGAHAGDDEEKVLPAGPADHGELVRRAHDAVEARALREHREAERGLAWRSGEPDRVNRGGVEGRQNRHRDELRRGKARLRGGGPAPFAERLHHLGPARGMAIHDRGAGADRRGGRAAHGIRDVVELQVEENAGPGASDLSHQGRSLGHERFEPQLQETGFRRDTAHHREELGAIGQVQRDREPSARRLVGPAHEKKCSGRGRVFRVPTRSETRATP